ncbi:MAG: preprotein translocase subunit SecE [Elusimicrobia bacterium]|nr:preprotein translocase subunit SecE [Candidatus Liberimonas magnetica]
MNVWFKEVIQFFMDAYAELRKVTWLSRKEAIASTIIVIVLVVIVAVFVGFADFVLARILSVLL